MYLMSFPMYWYIDSPGAAFKTGPSLQRRVGNCNSRKDTMGHRTIPMDENKQMTFTQRKNGSYSGAGCGNRTRQQGLLNPIEQLHSRSLDESPSTATIFSDKRSPLKQRDPNNRSPIRKTPQKLTYSKRGPKITAPIKQKVSSWSGKKYECTTEQSVAREKVVKSTKKFNFNDKVDHSVHTDPSLRNCSMKIPFCDSYRQTPFYPVQPWPASLDSYASSSSQEFGVQAPLSEPTSPVLSDKDCSFMTYSSDGISVIISNGNADYQYGMHNSEAYGPDRDPDQFEGKAAAEISFKDEIEVKPPSVYTPSNSIQDLQFSETPSLPNSISSQSRQDSVSSTSGLSSLFCDQSPPPTVSAIAADTKTCSQVMTLNSVSPTQQPPPPPPLHACSSIGGISSFKSPTNSEDEWLWFPAVVPPMRLVLRWVYFPAPPPNLPCREPILPPNEKPAEVAHYYLRGGPPDLSNIQYIEGNWTRDQSFWKWTPPSLTNENIGDLHCYELPTPPKPAKGAWYLVWPAELPMSMSPFVPGEGVWFTGTFVGKSDQPNSLPMSSHPITLFC